MIDTTKLTSALQKHFGANLQKALTTTGDGAALLPYDLDSVLHEELLKNQPLAVLMNIAPAGGKTHEYRVRSSHPQAWYEGETTPANNKNSVYAAKTVAMKIQRIWGQVSGFAQAADARFINALMTELEGSVEGMGNVLEFGTMWGASNDITFTGDAYQYSGIISRLFKYAPENVVDAGGDKITLDDFDVAISRSASFRGVRNDPKLWLMGTRMRQVCDGLQTKVQIPLTSAVLADGKITMNAYANIPIYETDYIVPADTSSSPADGAAATGGVGGTLTQGTQYFYKISSVTMQGEQISSAQFDGTTGGADHTINLTWTADPSALLYYIFRGTVTGQTKLIDIIPALTYDSAGTVNGTVASYADTGAKTAITQVKPLLTGEQNILLVNTSASRGYNHLGLIDDMGSPIDQLFKYVELARVKDTYDYLLKGYLSGKLVYPNLVALVRNCKLS